MCDALLPFINYLFPITDKALIDFGVDQQDDPTSLPRLIDWFGYVATLRVSFVDVFSKRGDCDTINCFWHDFVDDQDEEEPGDERRMCDQGKRNLQC